VARFCPRKRHVPLVAGGDLLRRFGTAKLASHRGVTKAGLEQREVAFLPVAQCHRLHLSRAH